MSEQDRSDLADELREIQFTLQEIASRLGQIARHTPNGEHYRSTVVASIEIAASDDHGWLSRDANIDEWIADIEGADAERIDI